MNDLLKKYEEKFDDQFPLMLFRQSTDEEIIKVIEDCLKSGKPYEPNLDENAEY